ncbi:hypothetical protein [Patiriisocius marinus]|uniref:hypothetical protein n=1 Tax=Patiriisocius marinus TaxID=1397112 RepID=UPI00232DA9A5|nr:hypothetical protein [Patiriisocius marinus]
MKTNYPLIFLYLIALFAHTYVGNAQVGINTTTPEGIIDVNSSTYGVVLPRISLNSLNNASPVINPQGGSLAVGTVVYNTNTTSTGSNDVVPGIYVWTGTKWFNKFSKKQSEFLTQTSHLRTQSSSGYQNIPGLTNRTFTAEYTGTYKIELSVNYGGGYLRDIDGDNSMTDVAAQKGNFRFTFDGDVNLYEALSYSVTGDATTSGTSNYYLIWEQYSVVIYKNCTQGQTYNLNLEFDQLPAPEFVNSGNHNSSNSDQYTQGTGWIGFDIPCSVEITYLTE